MALMPPPPLPPSTKVQNPDAPSMPTSNPDAPSSSQAPKATSNHSGPSDQSQESVVHTQQNESEESSQEAAESYKNLWGKLHPCGSNVDGVDLRNDKWEYQVGRHPAGDIVLDGLKISNKHCVISYDGNDVSVMDLSSNGTWIGGVRIPRNSSAILKSGSELSLGSFHHNGPAMDDFRWIFRQYRANAVVKDASGFWEEYELGDEIGRGSFATVHRCMQRSTRQWFAVKIIQRAKWTHTPSTEKNFQREIEIMTRLEHPNIIRLQAVFETPEAYSVVMDELKGGELLTYINASGAGLDEPQSIQFTRQICTAMAYLHSRGITHRDLKPENILMSQRDRNATLKVADFGLAKILDGETWLKTICGTPSYLAPEVISSQYLTATGYTDRVDSWSTGVIVYAMTTNAGAFIEDSTLAVQERVLTRTINWDYLRECGRLGPLGLDFVERLLRVNPDARMSLTEALEHPWLRDPYVASQGPFAPRERDGASGLATDDSSYTNMDVSTNAILGNPEEDRSYRIEGGPIDCSQDMKKLNISGEQQVEHSQPLSLGFKKLPTFEPGVDSKGEVKVPGFSQNSEESQSRATRSQRNANISVNANSNSASPSKKPKSQTNGHGRKRKADDEDSPLSSPPGANSSTSSHPVDSLPQRQTKAARYSYEDSDQEDDGSRTSSGLTAKPPPRTKPRSGGGEGGSAAIRPTSKRQSQSKKKPDSAKSDDVSAIRTRSKQVAADSPSARPVRKSTRKTGR